MQIDRQPGIIAKLDGTPLGYNEAFPGGPWIASITLPPDCPEDVLHFRVSPSGRIIGKGHKTGAAWYWTGLTWRVLRQGTMGNNIGAFGPNEKIYISDFDGIHVYTPDGLELPLESKPGYIGANGIRWVRPDGFVVSGDQTYGSAGSLLYQWTTVGEVTIGQSEVGIACRFDDDGLHVIHEILRGNVEFIRINRVADQIAICAVDEGSAEPSLRILTSIDELHALPIAITPGPMFPVPVPPVPPIPLPKEPTPMPDPVFDPQRTETWSDDYLRTQLRRALDYFRSSDDLEYWFGVIRSKPSHGTTDWYVYWVPFIRDKVSGGPPFTGDLGGGTFPGPAPAPAPTPTPVDLSGILKRLDLIEADLHADAEILVVDGNDIASLKDSLRQIQLQLSVLSQPKKVAVDLPVVKGNGWSLRAKGDITI